MPWSPRPWAPPWLISTQTPLMLERRLACYGTSLILALLLTPTVATATGTTGAGDPEVDLDELTPARRQELLESLVLFGASSQTDWPQRGASRKNSRPHLTGQSMSSTSALSALTSQDYVKASNSDLEDLFGSIDISGDTLVVGAWKEDSGANGVNGDQLDNNALDAGAVYVFVRQGGTWVQQAYLKASNSDAGDGFGQRVVIDGDTLVVGAHLESSASTTIGMGGMNNAAPEAGAAYVFVRNGTTWTQQAYLKASNAEAEDHFGMSLFLSGDTLVVASPGEDSNAFGVGGDQTDNSANGAGAVYLFERSGTTWSQSHYIKASNTNAGDVFGASLGFVGDTLLVGAPGEASSATGVDGDELDNSIPGSGAAYMFVRSAGIWTQEAYLKSQSPGTLDFFGINLALGEDFAAVGSIWEDSQATGIDGDWSDDNASNSGAAFVFRREEAAWAHEAYIKASNAEEGDWFGDELAIEGNTLVIGARGESSQATGTGGDQTDNSAVGSGAAYVFERNGGSWSQVEYLKSSNSEALDVFGQRVAIDEQTLVASSAGEDSDSNGVNGDQSDNSASAAGAVYSAEFANLAYCFCSNAAPCGNTGGAETGCANSTGQGASLAALGGSSLSADSLSFSGSGMPALATALLFQGNAREGGGQGLFFGDGLRCVASSIVRLELVQTDAGGQALSSVSLAGASGALPGDRRYYQLWYRDSVGSPCGTGFNLTNAVEVAWTR